MKGSLQLLNQAEREQLTDIFHAEFDSDLPDEKQCKILAQMEDGEIRGFITSEILIRVGLVWVKPELRETKESAQMVKDMIRYVAASIPKGSSVIVIASDEKFEGICEKSGMRPIDGKVYRKDF